MNKRPQKNKRLLFKHEVLRARLDIRDFFLENSVLEVYENIGQILSLVRMQLAILDSDKNNEKNENINSPADLVGQSIRDLRAICKSFYPDEDILKEEGFIEALKNTIEILCHDKNPVIKIKGIIKDTQPGLKLIVFKMVKEILVSINESEGELKGLVISYTRDEFDLTVSYKGKAIGLNESITNNGECADLTLQKRVQLIKGRITVSQTRDGTHRIKLVSPLNSIFYE
jgi:signal transduction histidine kinase